MILLPILTLGQETQWAHSVRNPRGAET